MFQLAGGTAKAMDYEDIVVTAWKIFPEDFGLRKYAREYPDASDIHKPLYGPLKDRGLVLSGNKKFKLTEKGLAYAAELERARRGLITLEEAMGQKAPPDRLSRDKEGELKRICETDAFRLFSTGQREKILDTDFYAFLGATVRTDRHEFLGRLKAVGDAVKDAARISQNPKHQIASDLYHFVCEKFAAIIQRKQGKS